MTKIATIAVITDEDLAVELATLGFFPPVGISSSLSVGTIIFASENTTIADGASLVDLTDIAQMQSFDPKRIDPSGELALQMKGIKILISATLVGVSAQLPVAALNDIVNRIHLKYDRNGTTKYRSIGLAVESLFDAPATEDGRQGVMIPVTGIPVVDMEKDTCDVVYIGTAITFTAAYDSVRVTAVLDAAAWANTMLKEGNGCETLAGSTKGAVKQLAAQVAVSNVALATPNLK